MIQRNPFENKRAILEKLVAFGFRQNGTQYRYEEIIDTEFLLRVVVFSPYETRISLIDREVMEENAFFLSLEKKVNDILGPIEEKCYEKSYIPCLQGDRVLSFLVDRFKDIFEKKKDLFVLRRKDTGKKYLSVAYQEKAKSFFVLFSGDDMDIDDSYFFSPFLREKKFNLAVKLDGSVPDKTLVSLLVYSRELNR